MKALRRRLSSARRRKSWLLVVAVSLTLLLGYSLFGRRDRESFALVKIGADFRVVPSLEVETLRAEAERSYTESLKLFQEARRTARGIAKPVRRTRPVKQRFTVVEDSLSSHGKAMRLREKHLGTQRRFVVARVRNDFHIIQKADIAEFKRSMMDEHQSLLAKYHATKKEATKRGQRFKQRPPSQPVIQVGSKYFASEAEAQEHVERMRAEWLKKKADKHRRTAERSKNK